MKKYSELSEDEKENRRLEFFHVVMLLFGIMFAVIVNTYYDIELLLALSPIPLLILILNYYSLFKYKKSIVRKFGFHNWMGMFATKIRRTDTQIFDAVLLTIIFGGLFLVCILL